jgi:protein-tyrosine-phosphatase
MATALFVCLHNAGRSQMSAALFAREAARVRELVAELDASDAGWRGRTPGAGDARGCRA